MKTHSSYTRGTSRYHISSMSAQEYVQLRELAIDGATQAWLYRYQWPTPFSKMQRNVAIQTIKSISLTDEEARNALKKIVRSFKRLVRMERTAGHFRGGKWRNVDYSK